MASFGPVVLSYGDSLIRQSEMAILRDPKGWLNDVLLSFYFEYLETSCTPPAKDRVKFFAATLSQFIKLCDQPEEVATFFGDINPANIMYAFWPINDSCSKTEESGSHWSLLVFSRPDNAFLHYDSFRRSASSTKEAKDVYKRLVTVFSKSANFVVVTETKQQANFSDCGLHVAANAELILTMVTKRAQTNQKFCQINGAIATADADYAHGYRAKMIEVIERLAAQGQALVPQVPAMQGYAPQLPAPMPQLPAPMPQLPAPMPQLPAPMPQLHAPMPQLPAPMPQLPAPMPQLPAPMPQLPAPMPQLPAPMPQLSAPMPQLHTPMPQLPAHMPQLHTPMEFQLPTPQVPGPPVDHVQLNLGNMSLRFSK